MQKIFFNPPGQNSDYAVMMAIDIGRFTGVVRFLMQPFDARHLLGLLADFDAIAGKQQPTINLNQWATG